MEAFQLADNPPPNPRLDGRDNRLGKNDQAPPLQSAIDLQIRAEPTGAHYGRNPESHPHHQRRRR